jgi:hypothetical protein
MNPGPPYTFSDLGSIEVGVGVPLRLAGRHGLVLADWWHALAAHDEFVGHYEHRLWWDLFDGGALRAVRLDDRIHLSPDGAFRAAYWTRAAVLAAWPASVDQS